MGNCCARFLKFFYRRRVLRQYTSLDAQTGGIDDRAGLFSDDSDGDGLISTSSGGISQPAITENEKLLLKSKNYAAIIKSQKSYDEQIDRQLAEQEERLRQQEEELISQKRSKKHNNTQPHLPTAMRPRSDDPFTSSHNSQWNIAGGEDDFDMFLDSIATREKNSKFVGDDDDDDEDEITEADFVSGFSNDKHSG